jgi:hypothetical protein
MGDGVLFINKIMKNKIVFPFVSAALLFAGTVFAQTKDSVIGAYFNVEQALINQDLNGAKTAATDLAQKAQVANNGTISKDANDLAKTDSLDQARQAFKTLSEDTLKLIQAEPASKDMACSMGDAQCMQTENTAQSSCMGSQTSSRGTMGCGMMRRNAQCREMMGCG